MAPLCGQLQQLLAGRRGVNQAVLSAVKARLLT